MLEPTAPNTVDAASSAAPRVVVDTQVLLDWLVFADASTARLAAAIMGGHVSWIAEAGGLAELRYVAQSKALAPYLPRIENIDDAVARHCQQLSTPLARSCGLVCRDVDDQCFIDLAIAAQARWLISRDKDLLALRKRAAGKGLSILRAKDWALDSA
jgi:putative PIN family toxin of toxin-antitoxin system